MHDYIHTILSQRDYDRLKALLGTMIGARTPFAALVRRKLGSAVIMRPTDLGDDFVTSNRKVRFKIDGVRLDERELLWTPNDWTDGSSLSLLDPRGLALLGLSTGQSISFLTDARRTQTVHVEHVFADQALNVLFEGESGRRPLDASIRAMPRASRSQWTMPVVESGDRMDRSLT
ncbi:MAG: hypothetical protein ABI398_14745 [Devosia sp.]